MIVNISLIKRTAHWATKKNKKLLFGVYVNEQVSF